mgnify:CR=1 FL=1
MGRWYSYILVEDDEIIECGTDFGVGVSSYPRTELVEDKEYDMAFVFYVNDTSDTGELVVLPERSHVRFSIKEGKPYYSDGELVFDDYDYNLHLGGNYKN